MGDTHGYFALGCVDLGLGSIGVSLVVIAVPLPLYLF